MSLEPGRLQREGMHLIHQTRVQQQRMAPRQGQQHVRLTHHHACRVVVLAAQKHLTAKPPPAQFDIDQAGTVAPGRDLNMALPQIGIQVEFVRDRRVTLPGDDHEWFIQEPLMSNTIAHRHGDVDGQIDRSTRQFGLQISALGPRCRDRHSRGGMRQASQQRRKNQGFGVFPQRQVKVPPRVFGNEIATLAEVHFQDLQRLPHLLNHVPRERRRHHVRPLADEQRVLQKIAQSLQRMADRGLGEVQLLAGASDVALAIDGFQHHEQVQVDLT